MTVQEFYTAVGSDYNEVIGRLGKEERIYKYLDRFAQSNSIAEVDTALEAKNWEAAFRATHSLKGVCLNLGIGKLGASSSNLCEMLRGGEPTEDITEAVGVMRADYADTMDAIAGLLASRPAE